MIRLSCGHTAAEGVSYRRCRTCSWTRCPLCRHVVCSSASRRRRPEPVDLPAPIPSGANPFAPSMQRCFSCDAPLATCTCYDEQLPAAAAREVS